MRSWKGKKHTVLVKTDGFDFQGRFYKSLSQIANDITGTRWNGHLFFGLKKKEIHEERGKKLRHLLPEIQ